MTIKETNLMQFAIEYLYLYALSIFSMYSTKNDALAQ